MGFREFAHLADDVQLPGAPANMKSPEYITHGTSSDEDAEKIKESGFEALEGRATVSCDLIYAFEWATKRGRRRGSKSGTEVGDKEKGRMIIMKVPEDKSVDYATHTNVSVDDTAKEVTGYSSKYESGRRQLAIYGEGDVLEKREKIEKAKQELKEIDAEFLEFFRKNGIDPEKIRSKNDLMLLIGSFAIDRQIELLKEAEALEKRMEEKRKEAEPDLKIAKENILMSVVPTHELGKKLEELLHKIKKLETVDLKIFTEEIAKIIEDNKENFLTVGLNLQEILGNLLSSTMETEIVNMVRSLSVDVKRVQGYKIFNRSKDEVKEKDVDREELIRKLERIQSIVHDVNFNIGIESLNRYIRINIDKLINELNS